MFEISIFCVILLAVSYWAVLWLMGRREDVLHGEFVEAGAQPEEPVRSVFPDRRAVPELAVRPIFPKPPAKTAVAETAVAKAVITKAVIATTAIPERPATSKQPAHAIPEQPAFRPERLESLLNSIKQDLNQLVQK